MQMFTSDGFSIRYGTMGTVEVAIRVFRKHGGILRTRDALKAGVHPRTLYRMRDEGLVEQVTRGVYRLAELPPVSETDLVVVATRVPKGVVCLVSALALHDLTTQIPHAVDVALARGSEPPRIEHPPTNIYWFSGRAFEDGIEERHVDGVVVRVYGPEKTLADCFKFRNRIGMDVCIEALREYGRRGQVDITSMLKYARTCHVERVMRPYMEALL